MRSSIAASYALHVRDTDFYSSVRSVLAAAGVRTTTLPARSQHLTAFAERWVRSVNEVSVKADLFGRGLLSRVLAEFSAHRHGDRNYQGKGEKLLFPCVGPKCSFARGSRLIEHADLPSRKVRDKPGVLKMVKVGDNIMATVYDGDMTLHDHASGQVGQDEVNKVKWVRRCSTFEHRRMNLWSVH